MSNNNHTLFKATALTAAVMLALCLLVEYGIHDYQERAKERQVMLAYVQQLKKHPLVLHGCNTDTECKKLDAMLAEIHASYN